MGRWRFSKTYAQRCFEIFFIFFLKKSVQNCVYRALLYFFFNYTWAFACSAREACTRLRKTEQFFFFAYTKYKKKCSKLPKQWVWAAGLYLYAFLEWRTHHAAQKRLQKPTIPPVTDILTRAWRHFYPALCGPYLQCMLGPFRWADGGPFCWG